MKLNLGCGEFRASGWINVDGVTNKDVRPDVVADITEGLPFDSEAFERVYMGHVLEHLTLDDQVPALMREVYRVLAPGGEMLAVGPDIHRARKTGDLGLIKAVIGGEGRWPGDQHHWLCEEALMVEAVFNAGFTDAQPVAMGTIRQTHPGWPLVSDVGWQCAAYGWKAN